MSAAVSLPAPQRIHLAVLSNSAMSTYRTCPRSFQFKYVKLRRTRQKSEALRFGSFFHIGLNTWWGTLGDASDRYSAAVHAMQERAEANPEDADPYELVKAEELIRGYSARWGCEEYRTISVEQQFDAPLVNPETGHASKTYRLQGAIDVIVAQGEKLYTIEHKTTQSDISPGADYWRKVSALDPQVSTYQAAARASGIDIDSTVYDVVRKVGIRPYKETPIDDRKYIAEKSRKCPFCAKKANVVGPHIVSEPGEPIIYCRDGKIITEPGGRLYANQHDHDETPEEFRVRVREHIAEQPERYFARGPVVRLENDVKEHQADVWQTAAMIRMSENSGHFPRNPGSCEKWGRLCEYFDVCSGVASIDDDSRFRTAGTAHEELATKEV